jgi:porphobilinogen synthase
LKNKVQSSMPNVNETRFHNVIQRPRRLRSTPGLRRLVQETRLSSADLVLPVFVREGLSTPQAISSMPGVMQHSLNSFVEVVEQSLAAGLGGLMIFGVPQTRDADGAHACSADSILAQAITLAKSIVGDRLPIIADLCLDEFTTHGHCGVTDEHGAVDNDATLGVYQKMAVTLARAGADILGLSGMMDGQVSAVRSALDEAGHVDTVLLAYAAKYASAFYGPFRDAVDSQLQGNRLTYQQDPGNRVEALREVALDVEQGADIVMVKPGMPYLDILRDVAQCVDVPVASYVVSGEYSMIEYAAQAGAITRKSAILETLLGVKRAGAGIIVNYWALEVAGWLSQDPR